MAMSVVELEVSVAAKGGCGGASAQRDFHENGPMLCKDEMLGTVAAVLWP